jgi:Sulfotransferase domain
LVSDPSARLGNGGTASLKLALERVGVAPCYHMFDVLQQPERAHGWLAAARGERPDWPVIFAGYGATVDWPGAAFWRELVEAYPDAAVILTVRDAERWYDSMERTIFWASKGMQSPVGRRMFRLATVHDRGFRAFGELVGTVVLGRVFGGRTDRAHAIGVYERHIAEVRATVPAQRLLVFDVAQGWQPLCAFLGVEVPDEPFPHVNDAAEFRRRRTAGIVRHVAPLAGAATLALAALVTVGRWTLRSRRRCRRSWPPDGAGGRN